MPTSPPTHYLPKACAYALLGGQSRPPLCPVCRTRTLFLSCHSEPVTDVTGVGIRPAAPAGAESLASLCEGGVTAFGRDGGRDMPRQRRGIKLKGRFAPRRGVLLPTAAKVPKNAVQTCGLKIPYAPSHGICVAKINHANAVPCKLPLNVALSLRLFSLPLLL